MLSFRSYQSRLRDRRADTEREFNFSFLFYLNNKLTEKKSPKFTYDENYFFKLQILVTTALHLFVGSNPPKHLIFATLSSRNQSTHRPYKTHPRLD